MLDQFAPKEGGNVNGVFIMFARGVERRHTWYKGKGKGTGSARYSPY